VEDTGVYFIFAGMVVVNHYFAFSYFATVWYPFSDVSILVKKKGVGVDIEAVRGRV
jgi:hypothetical protein